MDQKDQNNLNIIRISLDESDNSNNGLASSGRSEEKVEDDNTNANKNEEITTSLKGNDKISEGEEMREEKDDTKKIDIITTNNLEERPNENFKQFKKRKEFIFEIVKSKKNFEIKNEDINTYKNKVEEAKKLVGGKDGLPKCEISNAKSMSFRECNDMKEKNENIEKAIITTNIEEKEKEREKLGQDRGKKGNEFEIINELENNNGKCIIYI